MAFLKTLLRISFQIPLLQAAHKHLKLKVPPLTRPIRFKIHGINFPIESSLRGCARFLASMFRRGCLIITAVV